MRPAKFAKYLHRFGWRPYIRTIREDHIRAKDYTRFAEVSELPILRTRVWPTVLQLGLGVKRQCLRIGKKRNAAHRGARSLPLDQRRTAGSAHPRFARMKRYLNSILELPDEQIGWLIPALWAGYRLIKREGINVVLSSSPPRTTALVGLLLGELTGVKMITDLRDPWFAPYSSDPELLERWGWSERRSWLGDRIEMWLEKEIIERSTKVITTTEHHAQCLRRVYPWIAKDAFYTLRNGYDGEDITAAIDSQALACSQPKQKWTISYLGTFYSSRTPKEFLKALSELIKENSILPGEVEVNLIGHVRHASGELVEELVTSYGIEDYVKIEDPLPYKACLQRIVGADVLLLWVLPISLHFF